MGGPEDAIDLRKLLDAELENDWRDVETALHYLCTEQSIGRSELRTAARILKWIDSQMATNPTLDGSDERAARVAVAVGFASTYGVGKLLRALSYVIEEPQVVELERE